MTSGAAVGASARTKKVHCVQCSAGRSISDKGGSSRRVMPCSTCQLHTSMDGAVSASQDFLKCLGWSEMELEFVRFQVVFSVTNHAKAGIQRDSIALVVSKTCWIQQGKTPTFKHRYLLFLHFHYTRLYFSNKLIYFGVVINWAFQLPSVVLIPICHSLSCRSDFSYINSCFLLCWMEHFQVSFKMEFGMGRFWRIRGDKG